MNRYQYRLDRIAGKLSSQKRHIFYSKLKKLATQQDRFYFITSIENKLGLKSVYEVACE